MPAELLPYIPLAALVISVLALLVSFANLGWNVYKELALRGRLKITFAVNQIFGGGIEQPITRVILRATNFGPGQVEATMIQFKKAALWRRLVRRVRYGVIIWDYTDPLSSRLPHKLAVGETINLTFKYGPEFAISPGITHVGLGDSFGNTHWASRAEVEKFKSQHAKDFPNASTAKENT